MAPIRIETTSDKVLGNSADVSLIRAIMAGPSCKFLTFEAKVPHDALNFLVIHLAVSVFQL